MKTLASGTFFLLLGLVLSACERNEIDESKPLIKSISFTGIPASDVTIDQRLHQITVRVPALLPSEGLIPLLDLTHNSIVSEGLTPDGKLDLTRFCECGHAAGLDEESQLVITHDPVTTNNSSPATIYNVALAPPPGCPEPNGELPVTFTRHKSSDVNGPDFIQIHLPIRNLYQSTHVDGVFLKNVATGQTYTNLFYETPCINICSNDSINRLTVPFDTKLVQLPTGVYEVSVRASCEKEKVPIVFPTRITFTK
ncbi:hypothetical protein [Salmonirosea aquatica]|uniref:Uncharacterized protein n=1 Tax=Salmonirosea aquatica TaxID=2654236 RepID=A0A7C9BK69_9BACT|nr:hypothetical protein [Cytophagaceae bacterium SJW1-29]